MSPRGERQAVSRIRNAEEPGVGGASATTFTTIASPFWRAELLRRFGVRPAMAGSGLWIGETCLPEDKASGVPAAAGPHSKASQELRPGLVFQSIKGAPPS